MAVTKVYAVRCRLDTVVNYVADPGKTGLDALLDYVADTEKTEQHLFESVLNCGSLGTAYGEMIATKRKYGKTGGVLGYHFIQSFAPGEVTPEQAHAIGCEFAQRCFGADFEVVMG